MVIISIKIKYLKLHTQHFKQQKVLSLNGSLHNNSELVHSCCLGNKTNTATTKSDLRRLTQDIESGEKHEHVELAQQMIFYGTHFFTNITCLLSSPAISHCPCGSFINGQGLL